MRKTHEISAELYRHGESRDCCEIIEVWKGSMKARGKIEHLEWIVAFLVREQYRNLVKIVQVSFLFKFWQDYILVKYNFVEFCALWCKVRSVVVILFRLKNTIPWNAPHCKWRHSQLSIFQRTWNFICLCLNSQVRRLESRFSEETTRHENRRLTILDTKHCNCTQTNRDSLEKGGKIERCRETGGHRAKTKLNKTKFGKTRWPKITRRRLDSKDKYRRCDKTIKEMIISLEPTDRHKNTHSSSL